MYWALTLGLVVVAVLATLWVLTILPSRRRARAERDHAKRKATAQLANQRAELRMMPIRWEQEQRQQAYAEWKQRVEKALDPMVHSWLHANPTFGQVPKPVLDELFNFARKEVGPEPPL